MHSAVWEGDPAKVEAYFVGNTTSGIWVIFHNGRGIHLDHPALRLEPHIVVPEGLKGRAFEQACLIVDELQTL